MKVGGNKYTAGIGVYECLISLFPDLVTWKLNVPIYCMSRINWRIKYGSGVYLCSPQRCLVVSV